MGERRAAPIYAALYGSQFAHLGIQLPFFAGWLHLKGFGAAEIGWMAGGALGARLALGPLVALWSDRREDARDGLRVIACLFAVSAAALLAAKGVVLIGSAVVLLWSFGVLLPLADAGALAEARIGALDFGRTRALGSGAFLVATLAGGEILTRAGVGAAPALMAAAAAATFAAALLLPRRPRGRAVSAIDFADARRLLASHEFALMLAASALTQGSHAVYYSFSILAWSDLGYSPRVIGALWATGVVAEIFLLTRMKDVAQRISPKRLLALGATGASLRWAATALAPPLPVLFLVQSLHAASFAAAYMGSVGFIERAVPGRLSATALTVNSTLGVGAATGLATVVAGELFSAKGSGAAYILMAGMAAAGVVAALALLRARDSR